MLDLNPNSGLFREKLEPDPFDRPTRRSRVEILQSRLIPCIIRHHEDCKLIQMFLQMSKPAGEGVGRLERRKTGKCFSIIC